MHHLAIRVAECMRHNGYGGSIQIGSPGVGVVRTPTDRYTSGSVAGIKAVCTNSADVAQISLPAEAIEYQANLECGQENLGRLTWIPIAREPIVIVLNRRNPVFSGGRVNLGAEHLEATLFTGKSWGDLYNVIYDSLPPSLPEGTSPIKRYLPQMGGGTMNFLLRRVYERQLTRIEGPPSLDPARIAILKANHVKVESWLHDVSAQG